MSPLRERLRAEALGTAFLLAVVVGSGIMGERLAGGNPALALLANALATAAALVALILACGPVSGAHFNPAVTLALALRGQFPWREVPAYGLAQLLGAVAGVAAAQGMFELPLLERSTQPRAGLHLAWSEFVATSALLLTILATARHRPAAIPYAVAACIAAGYWFTASTSFANPAVTLARTLTDTFSGIAPADAPAFIAAQLLAALLIGGWRRAPAA